MTAAHDRTLATACRIVDVFTWLTFFVLTTGLASCVLLMLAALIVDIHPHSALARPMAEFARPAMWLLLACAMAQSWLIYANLKRIREVLASVREGDPFTRDNLARLDGIVAGVIAYLAVDIVSNVVGTVAGLRNYPSDFSVSTWFVALMLIVVAQVFAQGVRMRTELEGVV